MLKSIFNSSISQSPSSSDDIYPLIDVETKHNNEYNEDDWGFFLELDLENHIHDKIIRKNNNKNIYKHPIDEESQEEETKKTIYPSYPKIEYEMIYYICGVVAFVIFLN